MTCAFEYKLLSNDDKVTLPRYYNFEYSFVVMNGSDGITLDKNTRFIQEVHDDYLSS